MLTYPFTFGCLQTLKITHFLPLIIIKLFVMFWCRHRVVIPKRMPMIIKSWTSGVADAAVIIVIIFHVNLRYRSKILGIHPQTIAGVVHSVWSYFQIVEKCQGCRVLWDNRILNFSVWHTFVFHILIRNEQTINKTVSNWPKSCQQANNKSSLILFSWQPDIRWSGDWVVKSFHAWLSLQDINFVFRNLRVILY